MSSWFGKEIKCKDPRSIVLRESLMCLFALTLRKGQSLSVICVTKVLHLAIENLDQQEGIVGATEFGVAT